MNLLTVASLAVVVSFIAAGAVWYFRRAASATDLGSISRNWITEHRNDHE